MRHFIGIPDEDFIRGQVPMTKQEVRILTIAKARISEDAVILDIGAGTGSLSIEAALMASKGQVFAIERKAEGVILIKENAAKFAAGNLTVIEGEAPEALDHLPQSDVIFIGGSGKKLPEIIDRADLLLKQQGRLIINCVTVETLAETLKNMKKRDNYVYDVFQVQITRMDKVGSYHMANALNPISIITCTKA